MCLKACPFAEKTPLEFSGDKIAGVDRGACSNCVKCGETCYSGGIKIWGKVMTVGEVMKEILSDRAFYARSGGGATLNGGEVASQRGFAVEILRECRKQHVNTCVESSLFCSPEILEEFYPLTDLLITDIKHMDPDIHNEYIGADNKLILSNIIKTVEAGIPVIIRIPVIPGVNNDKGNIIETAVFIAEKLKNKVVQVQLLPYRKLGTEKYDSLGIEYPMGSDFAMPEREVWEKNILELTELMRSYGTPAVAGSSGSIKL